MGRRRSSVECEVFWGERVEWGKKRRVDLKAFSFAGRCTISPLVFLFRLLFFTPFFVRCLSLWLRYLAFLCPRRSFNFSLRFLLFASTSGRKRKTGFLSDELRRVAGGHETHERGYGTLYADGRRFLLCWAWGDGGYAGARRGTFSFVQTWECRIRRVLWERLFCSGLVKDGYGNELGRLRLLCRVTSFIAIFGGISPPGSTRSPFYIVSLGLDAHNGNGTGLKYLT